MNLAINGSNTNLPTTGTVCCLPNKEQMKKIGKCALCFFGCLAGGAATAIVAIGTLGFIFTLCTKLETHSWAHKLGKWAYDNFLN
jgi:hypothetical protein